MLTEEIGEEQLAKLRIDAQAKLETLAAEVQKQSCRLIAHKAYENGSK